MVCEATEESWGLFACWCCWPRFWCILIVAFALGMNGNQPERTRNEPQGDGGLPGSMQKTPGRPASIQKTAEMNNRHPKGPEVILNFITFWCCIYCLVFFVVLFCLFLFCLFLFCLFLFCLFLFCLLVFCLFAFSCPLDVRPPRRPQDGVPAHHGDALPLRADVAALHRHHLHHQRAGAQHVGPRARRPVPRPPGGVGPLPRGRPVAPGVRPLRGVSGAAPLPRRRPPARVALHGPDTPVLRRDAGGRARGGRPRRRVAAPGVGPQVRAHRPPGVGLGWVGLGQGLAWSPTHGPRRLPCRTRLGGRTRVSGRGSGRGGGGAVMC